MVARKVLIATEKPFAPAAVKAIEDVFQEHGEKYEVKRLESYADSTALMEGVKDANAVIVRSDKITQEVMNAAADLKLIVRAGAGVDTIDLDGATQRDIVVMNTPGQNANAVAELAFGMMLTNARNHYDGTSGYELKNKVLALYGYGAVARNMKRIADGFEMEVWAYDPFLSKEDIEKTGAKHVEAVDGLFDAQFVSLHCPCTDETKESIGKKLLLKMPKNGVLLNTARKEIIHEQEMAEAFQERTDLRYLADVGPSNLQELNKDGVRAFCTAKKMGAQTSEANNNAGIAAAKQIVDYFEKGNKRFQVNKPGQKF